VADAYETGLRMLARRELSEAQLRLRLERRQYDPDDIDKAVVRLRRDGALDDRRTALACARTEAQVKRHGRRRVLRQLEALGIARGIAKAAVAEVFADVDESSLLAQAIERRPSRPQHPAARPAVSTVEGLRSRAGQRGAPQPREKCVS